MATDQEPASNSVNAKLADTVKIAAIAVIALIVIAAAVFAAYRYSQRQKSDLVLPAGVTYLGASPTIITPSSTPPPNFTADSAVDWKTQNGAIYPYSFSYPSTLPLVFFTDNKTDKVAFSWGNTPPQLNILLNIELISEQHPEFRGKPNIEYVRNWWKFFSGLNGVASVQSFTNANGLKGHKAKYTNYANTPPNLNVFFEVPGNTDVMIHLANDILEDAIFDLIVDSVKWNE